MKQFLSLKMFFLVAALLFVSTRASAQEPYAVLSDNNTVLTFYYDGQKSERKGMDVGPFTYSTLNNKTNVSWYDQRTKIKKVIFDNSFAACTSITSTVCWFYECENLTTIVDISNLKTDNVTDMTLMFCRCLKLKDLDVSHFVTSNVKNMYYMFCGCGATSLDVSNFDTSNVTNMSGLFSGCKITSIDLHSFKTSNVTNMSSMFAGCEFTSLDLSGFDTANVTDMYRMFYMCNLTSLDLSSFDTRNVINMRWMFNSCSKLTSLDLSSFKTDNVTDMSAMFAECSNLTSLDVSAFKTDNVTNMTGMFYGCSKLTSLDVSHFNTENVTSMGSMFSGCSGLTSLDVSAFKTDNVTNMAGMFANCSSLTSLDLSNFKTDNVYDMSWMFGGCSSMTSLDVSSFKTDKVVIMQLMFYNCKSLSTLDIRNFDTSNATNMYRMLGGLGTNDNSNNTNIILGEKFNTIKNNAGIIFDKSTISTVTFTGNLPNLSDNTFSGVGSISNPVELVVPSQYAANYASQIGADGKFYGGYFKLNGYSVDTSMPEPNVGTKRLVAITRQKDGNKLERTDMSYDDKGRIIKFVYNNGTRTEVGNYKYDNDIISMVYDNTNKYEFYFANGKISTAPMNLESEGLTGTRYFEYDASDQLVKFTVVHDGSSNNRYAKFEWNNGSPSSVYYANLNTSTNTETEMYSATFTQNGMSAEPVVRALFGLCVSTPTFNISYDLCEMIAFYPYIGKLPQQLIGQAEHCKSGKVSVYDYSYETDNNGNITKVTITCDGKATVYTLEWEGSSTPPSTDITASETGNQDFGNGGGIDGNTNLNGNVVGNVYYNIASGGGGYNAVEGCIEITKPTDDSAIEGKDIFGEDFKNHFTGIVFKVAAGKGTIKVNAQTTGNMMIKVKVGSIEPYEMMLSGKVEAKFPYNVTEPTYVFVYASSFTGLAPGRASAAGSDVLRIYGLSWDDTTGIDELNSDATRDTPVYNLRGQRLAAPQKGINIIGGRKVVVK